MIQNIVILGGRLTADPELKVAGNGTPFCRFGVAYNPAPRIVNGVKKDADPVYVPVVAWGKQAEKVVRDFTKGSPILINGELESGEYVIEQGKANEETVYTNGVRMNYCQKISCRSLNQNFVLYSGHLARKTEVHQLNGDPTKLISTLVLIANGMPWEKDGQKMEGRRVTTDCVVRDNDARTIAKYADKGTGIWVQGKLYLHTYKTKKNQKDASLLKVSVKEWGFSSNKKDANTPGAEHEADTRDEAFTPPANASAPAARKPSTVENLDEDVPF